MEFEPPRVPTPAEFRRREGRRLAMIVAPIVALLAFALWPTAADPVPDLFAVLDEAEAAVEAPGTLPGEEALALLDDDDPLDVSDDLMNALMGEGSL